MLEVKLKLGDTANKPYPLICKVTLSSPRMVEDYNAGKLDDLWREEAKDEARFALAYSNPFLRS